MPQTGSGGRVGGNTGGSLHTVSSTLVSPVSSVEQAAPDAGCDDDDVPTRSQSLSLSKTA